MDDLLHAISNITHVNSPKGFLIISSGNKVEIRISAAGFLGPRTKFARFLSHFELI
jgi:hypothetical protein